MASIILIADKTSKAELQQIAAIAGELNVADLTVIADSSLDGFDTSATLIPSEDRSLGSALNEALRTARSENIALIGSANSSTYIREAVRAARDRSESNLDLLIAEGEEFTAASPEAMLEMLARDIKWPIAAAACSKQALQSAIDENITSAAELYARLAIQALVSGNAINSRESSANTEIALDNAATARSLSLLVNECAIEDLFPAHAWKEHSQESAATAYHTLAALFIRLGDSENANECLKISDSFEDSPRSLALKALIALNKGETLGAVANLVSSLQQYEERKKSTTHYVKFMPKNLESINSSLASGLEALNKRDNETALGYFADAVFNFDEFYADNGIASIKH